MVEDTTVAVVVTVANTDTQNSVEDVSVAIVATVTNTDVHNVGGTNFDETGRLVAVVATVVNTDTVIFVEGVSVAAIATVTGTDTQNSVEDVSVAIVVAVTNTDVFTPTLFDETGRLVAITATVISTDAQGYYEPGLTVAVVASVTNTDDYTPAGATLPFTDDWTGTNGDPWDSGKWTTSDEGSSISETDIQSNEGRMEASSDADDFNSATASSETDIQDAEVTLTVDPSNITSNLDQWLYVMLRSTGEQVAANAGRPATAYYWRFNVGDEQNGANDNLYRRISDSESSILVSDSGSSRNANEKFKIRIQIEDVGSDVVIRMKQWDFDDSEPGGWDVEYTDTSPGALHGVTGVLQLVARGTSGSEHDIRLDDLTYDVFVGATFNETGRTVAIVGTVTNTDVQFFDELSLTVAVVATVVNTDLFSVDETELTVAIVATVASIDVQDSVEDIAVAIVVTVTQIDSKGYDETGRLVAVVATVTSTDIHDQVEDVAVAIVSTVTSLETVNYVEDVAVAIIATVTNTDDFTGTGFDETGRLVDIIATVTSTDTVDYVEDVAVAGIVSTSSTDLHFMVEDVAVAIVVTVDSTDDVAGTVTIVAVSGFAKAIMTAHGDWEIIGENNISVQLAAGFAKAVGGAVDVQANEVDVSVEAISGFAKAFTISSDPQQTFRIEPAPSFAKAFGPQAEVVIDAGATYDETGRLVAIVSGVLSTDIATFTETAHTISIVSTVVGTDVLATLNSETLFVVIVVTVKGFNEWFDSRITTGTGLADTADTAIVGITEPSNVPGRSESATVQGIGRAT